MFLGFGEWRYNMFVAQVPIATPGSNTALDYVYFAAGVLAVFASLWGIVNFVFAPRMKLSIQETITELVAPQIAEVPKLTSAVERLTAALEHQSHDTQKLNTSIENLDSKIDLLNRDMSELSERTATLEGVLPSINTCMRETADIMKIAHTSLEHPIVKSVKRRRKKKT